MKNILVILFIAIFVVSCKKQNIKPLNQRIENFKVSECRTNCGIDSIGVSTTKSKSDLFVKFGYIVNCCWDQAVFKDIEEVNDTLIVEFDRPNQNGEYPICECDCFFYFTFTINNYTKKPKAIRVKDIFTEHKFWDERSFEHMVIEETIIDTTNIYFN
ncbi:hypothetical protein [Winogradskyella sp. SYSU M77433]|uniref:hypothetical protein n=1 Tax=Winogradskyella sp. SYSU M77433 TaxID=3042722 RepID=UPI0024816044|nr:hypothetical protein [Winogradskyella sp. SYSU M77433]MDH7913040.1 hypothetical protein [Winogradskyella sp. SYSU M77433]